MFHEGMVLMESNTKVPTNRGQITAGRPPPIRIREAEADG